LGSDLRRNLNVIAGGKRKSLGRGFIFSGVSYMGLQQSTLNAKKKMKMKMKMMMMMVMMMMMTMTTIVSVEQHPGWGEHVST
jgi:hypothetical protein